MKNHSTIHAALVASALTACALFSSCASGGLMQNRAPKLSQVQISPANKSIAKGTGLQLKATAIFSDGTMQNVTSSVKWQVSPASVATINNEGNLTGVGKGEAQVSATYQQVTGTASVTVSSAVIISLAVSARNPSLPMGESEPLTATAKFSDGSAQDVTQSATWQATPTTIATINAQGSLTGVGRGTAQVSAAYQGATGSTAITIGAAALVGITVGATQPTLAVGQSEPLTATGKFSDGSTQNLTQLVTWQSIPSSVATINAQGSLTAVGKGIAQVSAVYQGATGSAAITIGAAALVGITVSAAQPTLAVGQSEPLTATGKFSDGSTQNLTQLATWQSSPPTIATISAQGSLTGVGKGTAQVSAAYQGTTGSAAIAVGAAVPIGITVGVSEPTLPQGESEALTATAKFSDGSTQNVTQMVTWQATPGIVATVNAHGNLTGVGRGVAQITASYQGVTGNAAVTVGAAALLSITVNPNGSSLPAGRTEALSAIGTFSDGTQQNFTQSAAWSSSAPSIATVSTTGAVLAKAIGSTTISASVGSLAGKSDLSVTAPVIVSLNVTPTPTSLLLGKSAQLDAVAAFSDGSTQDVTSTATWSSQQPTIVGVNTTGLITAESAGLSTITASTNGASGSAAVTVTPLMIVSYFDRAYAVSSGIDGTVRIVNPGYTSGEMCAMIYVFDRSQELNECCGCLISDSGLLTLSLLNDLTSNPLTGIPPVAGNIEIVPATPGPGNQCNAGSPTPNSLLVGWETNVQSSKPPYQITEIPASSGPLSSSEAQVLATDCAMLQRLGSGSGTCTCGTGD
jgi:hypothetical protein